MNKLLKRYFILLLAISATIGAYGQEQFTRGLKQHTFVPKGQIISGISVGYSQSTNNNYQFLIIENITGDTYSFKVSPMFAYALKDNFALGFRAGYNRSLTKFASAKLNLGADTSYDIDHLYSLSHKFYGMGIMRNYISLGKQKRFGVFNEVQVEIGGGESKLTNKTGDDFTGTYEKTTNINIGLAPGMIMFMSNYSALEVNIGVVNFGYTHTRSTTDQIYISNRNSKSANLQMNLFSISFGVMFYL
ncbi:MAG: hypothetical protein J5784_03145 [Muribaculaceae bacterium]|nr:hypothetical protein [Muribaculaceae bacterium]MBP5314419.1 hypothetical protein [Muribaculaceae bacterium]MBR5744666.1 hypothetical protein [Muribaculaceae bacterium]